MEIPRTGYCGTDRYSVSSSHLSGSTRAISVDLPEEKRHCFRFSFEESNLIDIYLRNRVPLGGIASEYPILVRLNCVNDPVCVRRVTDQRVHDILVNCFTSVHCEARRLPRSVTTRRGIRLRCRTPDSAPCTNGRSKEGRSPPAPVHGTSVSRSGAKAPRL